ncbi:43 Kda Receptor-Associated Protein Of The Synapse [Manis pentadactyla]|nr:43 Kda Receptor-Associated Protein Of The Synapse [Manis pentadactyla]
MDDSTDSLVIERWFVMELAPNPYIIHGPIQIEEQSHSGISRDSEIWSSNCSGTSPLGLDGTDISPTHSRKQPLDLTPVLHLRCMRNSLLGIVGGCLLVTSVV